MAFKKRQWGAQTAGQPAQQTQPPREPTFTVKESTKDGTPYTVISGRVNDRGAMLVLYPSKFQGQFLALGINGWRGGMIPIKEDDIDVDEKAGTLKIDMGWLKVEVTGKNANELIEFLQAAQSMPKQASTFRAPAPAEAPEPQKPGWRK